jgi:exosortase family protein XrtF
MSSFSFQEFKPSIFFLLKFVGLYFVGNLAYGAFVHSYYPGVDPITGWVTDQTSFLLSGTGWLTEVKDQASKATAYITLSGNNIVGVYEGCNGVNVMIIFVAFLLSFGPMSRKLFWFLPMGLLIIHMINLARIYLLFLVALYRPNYLYFTHKYFFTGILYIAIFALWYVWILMTKSQRHESVA